MIGNPITGRLHRVALGVAALAALVPFVAACGSSSPSTSNAADTSSPKDGGNLTFLIQEFPAGWVSSESNISSYEGNLWGEITDKLVYVSSTGQVSPWIATSWQTEYSATKYILHLKPGVTFSDGEPLNAADAEEAGLVTFAPDEIDWDDEVRVAVEARAAFSPDAMTGLEANLRFAGPETMETKIFGRLTAWQNWIFQRPNAVGEKGALKVYGQQGRPEFDWKRT